MRRLARALPDRRDWPHDNSLDELRSKPWRDVQLGDESAGSVLDKLVRKQMALHGMTYTEAMRLEIANPANAQLIHAYACEG
jgi:hypothetical protein